MKCFITILIMIGFVSTGISYAERISVSVNSANVRTGPGTNYDIAWENLDRNYPLEVVDKRDSWYYVKDYENDVGWIHTSCIKKQAAVISRKDGCNIRSGPGTKYPIVFAVNNGVPFIVLKRKGDWIKVKHSDGDTGWIHKGLVW